MRNSLSRILVLTKRNIKETLRDPLSLIFTIGLPLAMEILFYLIFHELTPQFEMKYLAPGIVVFSQAFITLFTGLLLALDRSSSFLTRLYVSKAKPYEYIFGYALSVIPIVLVQAALFFLVGGIIDSSIFGVGMIWAFLLSIITALFFIGTGILFGVICDEKSIGGVSSIIICSQSVLSGMWFPIDGMSKGFITFMNCLPFRNASTLLQNALIGFENTYEDFVLPLIITALYAIFVFAIAIFVFWKKMKSK